MTIPSPKPPACQDGNSLFRGLSRPGARGGTIAKAEGRGVERSGPEAAVRMAQGPQSLLSASLSSTH